MSRFQVQALWKQLLSYRKRSWTLADYPVRVRVNPVVRGLEHIPAQKYVAQIVNWWVMSGGGDTPEEAVADLDRAFQRWIARGENLPRPGTKVPLRFAPSDRIDRLSDVAKRFLKEVVRVDPASTFLSNQSTLWSFTLTDTIEPFQRRTLEVFGVDISDVEDGNLVRIFERIDRSSSGA